MLFICHICFYRMSTVWHFIFGMCVCVTLHTFLPLVCIIVFLVPPGCPGPQGPWGKSCPQTGSSAPAGGRAGSCRASEVCWLALNCSCWRWKSIRLFSFWSLSISASLFSLLSLSPPAAPQSSPSPPPSHLSCSQVERQKRRHGEEAGEGL